MEKLDNHKTRGNHRICEAHFEAKYVQRSEYCKGRKFLSKDAFPTLCLDTSNMIVPMRSVKPTRPLKIAQNVIWEDRHVGRPVITNTKQVATTSRYNLRPIKRENRLSKQEENTVKNNVLFNYSNEVYIKVKQPLSPPNYEDASQFCESIIKVSQSTQTPRLAVVNAENNKRKFEECHEGKRLKVEDNLNDENLFLKMCSKFLSPSLSKLVKWHLSTANGEHHINFTLFALNLYYSSNVYNLLRDMLSLPHKETFKYFLLPKTTMLSENFLNTFRCKINHMSTKERICSFSVGSILLKPNLYYDIKYDRVIGLHDINGVQNIHLAKYAILVMVQGILENWRQPIAYALISEYDNSPEISIWIDDVLSTLIDIGLDIRAFVTDPRSEFLYQSESRLVTPERTYFTINGTNIFYVYDSSQLLKIVKNNLKSCDFYYGSNSPVSSNDKFLREINNLCKVLNTNIRYSKCQYKRAFANKKYQKSFLTHMGQLFQTLKVLRKADGVDVTENMKFIESFQITISSVVHLFEELNFLGVKYLLTSRLSLNCLNRFFGHVKQSNYKEECTPRQFNRCFVRSLVFNMLKKPISDRNIENSLDSEDFSQQLLDDEIQETESISNQPLLIHTTDYRENLPEKNAFVYVCGYCYLKCIQVHSCETFQRYLDRFKRKQDKDDQTFVCSVSLDLNVENCKLLPPDEFTDFLMLLESKFQEYFKRNVEIRNIGQDLLQEFEQYGYGMPCPCFPIDYLKALFVRVRLFYTIRKNNKLLMKKKGVKSLRIFSL